VILELKIKQCKNMPDVEDLQHHTNESIPTALLFIPQDDISIIQSHRQGNVHRDESRINRYRRIFHRLYTSNFVSDEVCYLGSIPLFENTQAVRVFKFVTFTLWIVLCFHLMIRSNLFHSWEKDVTFDSNKLLQVDFSQIVTDCLAFSMAGRVFEKKGIDRLEIIVPIWFSCVYTSWTNQISYLQYHISINNIMNEWPWQMILYAMLCVSLFLMILALHLSKAILDRSYLWRAIESVAILITFVAIKIDNYTFHLHHYYYAWILGIFFNRQDWWSELSMALCWGIYCNGVATYGRDPVVV
jgi:hypothetical protein